MRKCYFFSFSENCDKGETVTFKVIYNKQKYDVTFELDKNIMDLKKHIQTLTGKELTGFFQISFNKVAVSMYRKFINEKIKTKSTCTKLFII